LGDVVSPPGDLSSTGRPSNRGGAGGTGPRQLRRHLRALVLLLLLAGASFRLLPRLILARPEDLAEKSLRHPQLVRDVAHAGHVLDDVLRAALLAAILHRAGERDLAVAHLHGDVGRVDHGIVRQAIAHVLGDALVGTAIALRAAADVRAVRLV